VAPQVELMGKPAGIVYEAAQRMLGLQASELLAIGDSLVRVRSAPTTTT